MADFTWADMAVREAEKKLAELIYTRDQLWEHAKQVIKEEAARALEENKKKG